jgi:hypothetical protein
VTDLIRRFRALGIALVVLAMSATMAFAAAPHLLPTSSHGPVAAEDPSQGDQGDESEAPETDAPETDAPETEAPETEAPDTQDTGTADAQANTDTHGALVSAAAAMPTPAGFANHGAFVSCVAHMKDATLATIDWTTVTPESCAAANTHGKSADTHGKSADAKARNATKKAQHAADKAAREAARLAAGHGKP